MLFDNANKKFHASFLIRGYVAISPREIYENNQKSKTWNTQDFWYDFFGGAYMLSKGQFNIEWIDNGEAYDSNEVFTMERIKNKLPFGDGRKWAYTKNRLSC